MWTTRTSAIVALITGPLIGAAVPFVQLAFECRAPHSEACVWGKSLLPLGVVISGVVVGGILAVALFFLLEWRRRARENHGS